MSGSYTDWYVGMEVVRVDDQWHDPNPLGFLCPLVARKVYTVTSLIPSRGVHRGRRGHVCVKLAEVRNPYEDCGFAAARFRKVQPRKTDISIFTRFLNDADAPIREDA